MKICVSLNTSPLMVSFRLIYFHIVTYKSYFLKKIARLNVEIIYTYKKLFHLFITFK
jgi:hypothetical protein